MSKIRSRDTKPELVVRSLLHRLGYRFRLHALNVTGRPDIVLPRYRSVIFVHGCFWHRHKGCALAYEPKSGREFWQKKFQRNIERDERVKRDLLGQGWQVIYVWECELKDLDALQSSLLERLPKHGVR
jgi:DNA mismatch endonuclease, patch repair protein